jgi:branched-chain amino acid transport system permease protein
VLNFSADRASLWRLIAYGVVLVVVMRMRPQGLLPEGLSLRKLPGRLLNRSHGRGKGGLPPPEQVARGALAPTADLGLKADAHALTELSDRGELPSIGTVSADGNEIVLSVTNLSKRFGGITAADALTMQLRRGMITALVGPNGAGKTTVFNLLTGAIRPDAGEITLNGRDITGLRPDDVAKLGMVRSFQDVRTFPRLTVAENVMLAVQDQPGERISNLFLRPGLTSRGERKARQAALQWLSFVGMESFADYPAGALAFGQQKLVALARILATNAEVVLLDEPASGIDQQWVDVMLGLIEELRTQRRTVCIVEHNLHVVGRLADHTYFMELGRITAQGTFEELTGERRLAEAYFGTA